MNLQKIIVLPIDVYNNLKSMILIDEEITSFDRDMKKILHNRKLSDVAKWDLYREKMIHYGNNIRNHKYDVKEIRDNNKQKSDQDASTQTRFIFKRDKESNTGLGEKDFSSEVSTQTDYMHVPLAEEYFVSSNTNEGDSENTIHTNNDTVNDSEILGMGRVKRKLKSKHSDIKMYEMSNGEIVTVLDDEKEKQKIRKTGKQKHTRHVKTITKKLSPYQLPKKRKSIKTSTPEKHQLAISWENLYK